MVGIERSTLPALAQEDFHVAERAAILSFIAVFGVTKAAANYFAGRFSDRWGRKPVLIVGWLIAIPTPFLIMWAPTWGWVVVANVFLGISQGLTWSTAVIMKIDLAGPRNRGLAMGLNEFAGYFAVAMAALAAGWIAANYGIRPQPFYLGVAFVAIGLLLSTVAVRETRAHAAAEALGVAPDTSGGKRRASDVFNEVTFKNRSLSSVTQAGLVNNLNDGMAWGLFPLVFAAAGLGLEAIGVLAALYPGVWGIGQLLTGPVSDKLGRKWLIAAGMWVQAIGIALTALASGFQGFAAGAILLGAGTAMVYPTLLAAVGDVAHPQWRASAVGVYRLWRDLGYAFGALIAGLVADWLGVAVAIWLIAALTFVSGAIVAIRMRETLSTASS